MGERMIPGVFRPVSFIFRMAGSPETGAREGLFLEWL